jgi:hypothetical protein
MPKGLKLKLIIQHSKLKLIFASAFSSFASDLPTFYLFLIFHHPSSVFHRLSFFIPHSAFRIPHSIASHLLSLHLLSFPILYLLTPSPLSFELPPLSFLSGQRPFYPDNPVNPV